MRVNRLNQAASNSLAATSRLLASARCLAASNTAFSRPSSSAWSFAVASARIVSVVSAVAGSYEVAKPPWLRTDGGMPVDSVIDAPSDLHHRCGAIAVGCGKTVCHGS